MPRPGSPARSGAASRQQSPLHRPESPINRSQSPVRSDRHANSAAGKMSSSYDLLPQQGSAIDVQRTISDLDKARRAHMMHTAASDRNITYHSGRQSHGIARVSSNSSAGSSSLADAGTPYDDRGSASLHHSPLRLKHGSSFDQRRRPQNDDSHDEYARNFRHQASSPVPGTQAAAMRTHDSTKMESPLPEEAEVGGLVDHHWSRSASSNQWTSSPSMLQNLKLETAVWGEPEATCKYCNLTGPVDYVSNRGPQHNRKCKRFSDRVRDEMVHHEQIRSVEQPVARAMTKETDVRKPARLNEQDQKKKEMLHKQMLDLKKQLQEQLQRLHQTALVNGQGQAARSGGGAGPQAVRSSTESPNRVDGHYDRL